MSPAMTSRAITRAARAEYDPSRAGGWLYPRFPDTGRAIAKGVPAGEVVDIFDAQSDHPAHLVHREPALVNEAV